MSTICSLNMCILYFSWRFLNGHLPSAQSSIQPVLTAVAHLCLLFPYTYNDVSCSVQQPFSTISSRTRGKLGFFTPLFSSFSPLIFLCFHLSFNLKTQKKPGRINTACSPTLQSNCTGSYTTSKQKVQITAFIILTPYSFLFSVLIVL